METNQILALTETFEGHAVSDHFVDVNKMVQLAKRAEREIDDLMLKNPDSLERS